MKNSKVVKIKNVVKFAIAVAAVGTVVVVETQKALSAIDDFMDYLEDDTNNDMDDYL